MTHVEIVHTEFEHIRAICENMREREREALRKLGAEPEKYVTHEVASSFLSYTGLVDGQVVAMCGAKCAGILSDEAYVWMLASSLIDKYPLTFVKHGRTALCLLKHHFRRLHGLVLCDFDRSIRWLEWIGFTVDPPTPDGLRKITMEY